MGELPLHLEEVNIYVNILKIFLASVEADIPWFRRIKRIYLKKVLISYLDKPIGVFVSRSVNGQVEEIHMNVLRFMNVRIKEENNV